MKKIILLSDGTGNGAAKRQKTNVWRLYRALNLHCNDQIAMYDDGVGSQQFLLFKLLGGVFGWGLKRNVIELYKFLCRNYEVGEKEDESDSIYLFGFSRGAFTVRVLAGMIDKCGLCTNWQSEANLHAIARANYAVYREKYEGWRLSRLFPRIRNRSLIKDRSRLNRAARPNIQFMGVWDTVDAYGLPFDGLTKLWDRFISAMRFEDRDLSKIVLKACHALSVDDERLTFHPVLWRERENDESDRIEQVWFPGVHSDVGGGYPQHDLAFVSLDWMISRARTHGLAFHMGLATDYMRRSNWSGIQHDSRSGLKAFYRYKPRNIDKLCEAAGVARPPKIHRSVFERIRGNVVPYAPTGIPSSYSVVATMGTAPTFETKQQIGSRVSRMKSAQDVIYWREWLYWAFLATTFLLLASPAFMEWKIFELRADFVCFLDPVCESLGAVLPKFFADWVGAFCQNPILLGIFVAIYGILSMLKQWAAKKLAERATTTWS